jgi:hypothetical protein
MLRGCFQRATVAGLVELEVAGPDHVRSDRTHRTHRRADAGESLLAFPVHDAQALVTPQSLDPLAVHVPAFLAGLMRRAPPTPPRATQRERAEPCPQHELLIAGNRRGEALR